MAKKTKIQIGIFILSLICIFPFVYSLTDGEISWLQRNTKAYYNLEDSTITDIAHGQNGFNNGTSNNDNGIIGKCRKFLMAETDFISLLSYFENMSTGSVLVWFKTSLTSDFAIYGYHDQVSTGNFFNLYYGGGDTKYKPRIKSSGDDFQNPYSAVNTNLWHLWVTSVGSDGNVMFFDSIEYANYIEGNQNSKGFFANLTGLKTFNFGISYYIASIYYKYTGLMDEIIILNNTLKLNQTYVDFLYNNRRPNLTMQYPYNYTTFVNVTEEQPPLYITQDTTIRDFFFLFFLTYLLLLFFAFYVNNTPITIISVIYGVFLTIWAFNNFETGRILISIFGLFNIYILYVCFKKKKVENS